MKSAQSKTPTMRRHRSQRAATDSATSATRLAQRVGFTLVELLMVILIIGLLVSMLAVAINPALTRVYEGAIQVEMKQMEVAFQNFRNEKGFYPPSFEGFDPRPAPAGPAGAQLLPFLNKLSPNHRENSPIFPGGLSRLDIWWNAIGRRLDDRGSLIFWLNGLSTNKQFPITGGLAQVDSGGNAVRTGGNAQLPVIFAADLAIVVDPMGELVRDEADIVTMDSNGVAIGPTFERDALFDLNGGQISDEFFNYELAVPALDETDAGIRVYNSPYGNEKFDLAYRYRNAAFYNLTDLDPANPSMPVADRSRDASYVSTTDGGQIFLNPKTFQLSTFGLDGRASVTFATSAINKPPTGTAEQRADWLTNGDNIANFAAGRLDGFDWTESVELGSRTAE